MKTEIKKVEKLNRKQEEKVMKTRNSKLQKTEFTSVPSLIVFVAAVMVLSAKATATEVITSLYTRTEALAEVLASEKDAEMNIENWMLNESNFFYTSRLEAINDASLEMESWMMNANVFTAAYFLETETEKALNVAEWMRDESNFLPVSSIETEMEDALKIENWMMNTESFNVEFSWITETDEVLNVEEWMLNGNTFNTSFALENEMDNVLKLEAWMLNDTAFHKGSTGKVKTETLAMTSTEQAKPVTTIEYKDAKSGITFLFKLAEAEEPEIKLENWMIDKNYWNSNLKTK